VAVGTALAFQAKPPALERVIFCAFDERTAELHRQALGASVHG
jgi:hypothetical protein